MDHPTHSFKDVPDVSFYAFPRTLVDEGNFAHFTRFCLRSFVGITETYAKAELVTLGESQHLDIFLAEVVVCEHAYRAAEADGADSKRPC